MHGQKWLATLGAAAVAMSIGGTALYAAEAAYGTYGLGTNAFGAGATPPPGTYVTTVAAYIQGEINGAVPFNRVTLNAGATMDFFVNAYNVMWVPDRKLWGGNLGLSVSVPVGHISLEATVGIGPLSAAREVDGWGLGDIVPKAQLGWQSGQLSYSVWLQTVLPTGRYSPTFAPNIGLNRPGIDVGAAYTWTDTQTKLQFNGAAGFTFNFENDAPDYKTGTELHYEWAIGREISQGLMIGVVGYNYRQLTGDSGAGATLGSFKSQVDAIGLGMSYATLVGGTPFVFSLRHYHEFNAEARFEGNQTLASGTVRF